MNVLPNRVGSMDERLLMKHSHLVGFLETICQGLELSQTRLHEAEKRSQGVGSWLAASDDPDLQALDIEPPGFAGGANS